MAMVNSRGGCVWDGLDDVEEKVEPDGAPAGKRDDLEAGPVAGHIVLLRSHSDNKNIINITL